jgi:hypothetical protein
MTHHMFDFDEFIRLADIPWFGGIAAAKRVYHDTESFHKYHIGILVHVSAVSHDNPQMHMYCKMGVCWLPHPHWNPIKVLAHLEGTFGKNNKFLIEQF